MLQVKKLCICYGKQVVLNDGDFWADIGLTCIIGESGSGKSSILNALMNHVEYQCEAYWVNGHDLNALSNQKRNELIRNRFAYLSQTDNFVSDMSCYDNIRFYANMAGIELSDADIQHYLEMVNLKIESEIYPDQLSGGEKQRLALAQALAKKTEVILCDEMTASLDSELKQEIYELLEEVAVKYEKIIVVTTHDEEIYERADHLYCIEDQQLISVKKPVQQGHKIRETRVQSCDINRKYFKKYIWSKCNRQVFMFALYSLMSAIVVVVCSSLAYYRISYLNNQHRVLNMISQIEINVTNQTLPNMPNYAYHFESSNAPFNDNLDIETRLASIAHVEKVYPYYTAALSADYSENYQGFVNNVYLTLSDGTRLSHEINETSSSELVTPYYPEQFFERKQCVSDKDESMTGAYLNRTALYSFGLDEQDIVLLKDATINTIIYVPVSIQVIEGQVGFPSVSDEVITTELYNPIGVGIELSIPVAGVLDSWYTEDFGGFNLYIPYELMAHLREEASLESDNEFEWSPNTYRLYLDDSQYLEDVSQEISDISDNISIGSSYMNLQALQDQRHYINTLSLIALFSVFVAGIILSYLYGIFYYQRNSKDVIYFKRNGITNHEFKQLLFLDVMLQSSTVIAISVPLLFFAYYLSMRLSIYIPFEWRSFVFIFIGIVVFSYFQTIVSRLYYFRKIKHTIK